jgi:threonine/homoserine/homoserine lactone efflux protein
MLAPHETLNLYASILASATYAFAAAVQPGPLQAYLISQTLCNGWRRTIPAAFAPILSDIPIILLVLLLLTQMPPLAIHLLQLSGGGFLLYLAYGAAKSFRASAADSETPPAPIRQTVLNAVVVNLLNPNPYLGWTLIMGPLLLNAWHQAPVNGILFVITFYVVLVATTGALLGVFARARTSGPRVAHYLIGVSAAALALFGILQLWSGISSIIQ